MKATGILDSLRRTLGVRRASAPAGPSPSGTRPVALVYRGPTQEDMDCADTVVDLLATGPWGLDVRTAGPGGDHPLSPGTLATAQLYAQPGGGDLTPAYRKLKPHKKAIRDFVGQGGHYLGFCLGGYLAGQDEGFGLLSGEVGQYIHGGQHGRHGGQRPGRGRVARAIAHPLLPGRCLLHARLRPGHDGPRHLHEQPDRRTRHLLRRGPRRRRGTPPRSHCRLVRGPPAPFPRHP